MAFGDLALSGSTEVVTLMRAASAGTFSKGMYTASSRVEIEIDSVCVAIGLGKVLKIVPEANRVEKHMEFYTKYQLEVGDIISRNDILYEILSVEDMKPHADVVHAIGQTTDK